MKMKVIFNQLLIKYIVIFLLNLILYSSTFSQNNYSINLGVNCSELGTNTSPNVNFGDVVDMGSSFTFGGWYYANSNCTQHVRNRSKKEIDNGYQGWDIGMIIMITNCDLMSVKII